MLFEITSCSYNKLCVREILSLSFVCGAYFFEFRGRNLVCFGIAYNFDWGRHMQIRAGSRGGTHTHCVFHACLCPRCVTKSLLAELPMAGIGNTSCESLFLDEGEVKVRMYGEDFLFRSIIRTGCLGITRLRRDCCRLPGLNSLTTHNLSSRGCVFFFLSIRANCVRFVRYDRNHRDL